jgi:hypothetical protein
VGAKFNIRSGSDLYSTSPRQVLLRTPIGNGTLRTACYDSEEGEEDTAMDFTFICALLQLCDDDFDTEDGKRPNVKQQR